MQIGINDRWWGLSKLKNNTKIPFIFAMRFVWDEEEAQRRDQGQKLASGCGATAIFTLLEALNIERSEEEVLQHAVLRLRANDAPLAQYLHSRSQAGCSGEEIVSSVQSLLPSISGKFYTPQDMSLHRKGLASWVEEQLEQGKQLIATLNLQLLGNDAWHHQFIFGADSEKGLIYMMNPITAFPEEAVMQLISTPSLLLVQREDVLSRVDRPGSDLTIFEQPLWEIMNIPQQIQEMQTTPRDTVLAIPAIYRGGVACFSLDQTEI